MRVAILLSLLAPALARQYTTTIAGEVVVATVWTTAGDATTSIYDTIDVLEETATANAAEQTTFTPSGTISIDTTNTYYAPKPTRIATLGSHAPMANSGLANVTVTQTTAQVPSGTRQDIGAFQSALASGQATQSSAAGAGRALPAAPALGLSIVGAAVGYALV